MLTLTKYLFGLPSDRTADIFAVFVQADIPQDCAETTLVPLGMTAKLGSRSANQQPLEGNLTLNNGPVDRKVSINPRLPRR